MQPKRLLVHSHHVYHNSPTCVHSGSNALQWGGLRALQPKQSDATSALLGLHCLGGSAPHAMHAEPPMQCNPL